MGSVSTDKNKVPFTELQPQLHKAADMVKELETHLKSFLPNPEKTTVIMWIPDSEAESGGLKFIFSTV